MSAPDVRRVVLRDYPIGVWLRTQQHYDELLREFSHITNLSPAERSHEVPVRLIALIEALREGYASVSSAPAGLRERAANEGRTAVDLEYAVPDVAVADLRADVLMLVRLLDEADDYCRSGIELLTLSSPAEVVEFRRWMLGEFVAQLQGHPAVSWADRDSERLHQAAHPQAHS